MKIISAIIIGGKVRASSDGADPRTVLFCADPRTLSTGAGRRQSVQFCCLFIRPWKKKKNVAVWGFNRITMFCMPWRTTPQVGKRCRGESKSTPQEQCIHFGRYRQRRFLRRNGKTISTKPAVKLHICAHEGVHVCKPAGRCTVRTEASINAVLVTHLAFVAISTGVSAGTATLLIHHVERATFGCSTQKLRLKLNDNHLTQLQWIICAEWLSHIYIYLPHSCLFFHWSGLPPAWAHCREYSDTVEHKHELLLLLQEQRSFMHASMKASVSIRSWQLENAGPVSRFLQMSICRMKHTHASAEPKDPCEDLKLLLLRRTWFEQLSETWGGSALQNSSGPSIL